MQKCPEAPQRDVQSAAAGEEQPHAPMYAGAHPSGRQLGRKCPGGPKGHQVEQDLVMCPCHKEGQILGYVRRNVACRTDPSALLNSGKVASGVLCPDTNILERF